MNDFGRAGLRFDFLDDIFGGFLKGRGSSFSFRSFGGRSGRMRSQAWPGQEINLDEIFAEARRTQDVPYELAISQREALQEARKILKRRGKRLEIKIPPG